MKLYFVLILIMIFPIVLSAHDGDDRDDKDDHKREKIIISSQVIHSINSNYQKDIKPIFKKKCFDCHTSKPNYPWYVNVPGLGYIMREHNREGEEHLDLTNDFPFKGKEGDIVEILDEIVEEAVEEDEMPPWYFKITHWDACLTDQEKEVITKWIESSKAKIRR